MKICTRCKELKPLDAFSNNSRNKTNGKQPKCKACNALYERENFERISRRSRLYRARVKDIRNIKQKTYRDQRRKEKGEEISKYHQIYYINNKERLKKQKREYYLKNRKYFLETGRLYAKNNRYKMNALTKKYKAMKKQAIPTWADFSLIRLFYKKAEELTKITGIIHHVDHIVPIRSKIVCGLHCQQNLQVISGEENKRKNNFFWPDMP